MVKTEGKDRNGKECRWCAEEKTDVGVGTEEDRSSSEKTVGCVEGKAEGRVAIGFPYKLESPLFYSRNGGLLLSARYKAHSEVSDLALCTWKAISWVFDFSLPVVQRLGPASVLTPGRSRV